MIECVISFIFNLAYLRLREQTIICTLLIMIIYVKVKSENLHISYLFSFFSIVRLNNNSVR